jgi:hypothetical protein
VNVLRITPRCVYRQKHERLLIEQRDGVDRAFLKKINCPAFASNQSMSPILNMPRPEMMNRYSSHVV